MGGMGGGVFAVPDDVSLSDKASAAGSAPAAAPRGQDAGDRSADGGAPAGDRDSVGPTAPFANARSGAAGEATGAATDATASVIRGPRPIRLEAGESGSLERAWDRFYAETEVKTPEQLAKLDQRIRATVRRLNGMASAAQEAGDEESARQHFGEIRTAVAAAMKAGHVQPWMYQAYAIALQATGAPAAEVERALLSAVDFAETPEDVLHVAARLEDIGSHAAALELCKAVSSMDPYRREPYVMGLRLAKKSDNTSAIAWACEGVLSHAWPESFRAVVAEARLLARATYNELVEQGETEEAARFNQALEKAASHDVIARVTWTGQADIDLAVEEPSGTVCSLANPTTSGGGTLLGDSFPGVGEDESGSVSETYICPRGFSGRYRLLLRRIWGNVSTGHATVELLTDVGRPTQRYIRKQVPLTEKDALVVFEVKEGQRKQEIAEAQLAHLRDVQRDINEQMLGQFAGGNDEEDDEARSEFLRDLARLSAAGRGRFANNPFFRPPGAVGFRPELTVLPEGASLSGLAIISADRRYVRITPSPTFSQIGNVTTFNFVTGEEGGDGAGLDGGGGGGRAAVSAADSAGERCRYRRTSVRPRASQAVAGSRSGSMPACGGERVLRGCGEVSARRRDLGCRGCSFRWVTVPPRFRW